jgi:hypothetical protein
MCFSPEADLVAGLAVGAVGIDALRRVRDPKELPLASLPLLLGVHQLIETFVWWGLEGKVPAAAGETAIWLYLAIAFVLPLWVPLAVRGVEPSHRRRSMMLGLACLGFVVSSILVGAIGLAPADAAIEGFHIAYTVDIPRGALVGVLYVVATCGALLMASDRWIRSFGASNLVAVTALAWVTVGGLTSLWCVWAAITSVAIDVYLREGERSPRVAVG